jgi:NAD(P)-dependent dehydrogenase (short-subunit alcohol dehydrogenase family)
MSELLLNDKTAIIYGAGGGIGGGVAATFAREGARVHLVGRTREPLEAVAAEIADAGGSAEVAVLDALDERAVDEHADAVAAREGRIDVSFNLITRGDVQGIPLVDMTWDDLQRAVTTGLQASFVTARAAARHMTRQGSGVVLHLTSASSRGAMPGMGSTGPADAAQETFLRYLAAELGPQGVRVVGIHTAGVVETLTRAKVAAVDEHAPDPGEIERMIAGMSVLRRAPRLPQVAETAAFLASDRAGAITGTIVNATAGLMLA